MPTSGSVIKFPREGRIKNRGVSEIKLENCIGRHFQPTQLQIFSERFMVRGKGIAPYEPDITLQDEKSILADGKSLNLFMDIEIDEPYDLATLLPTHCKGEDNLRDKYFNKFGWIVIRFSEKQVIQNSDGCVLQIAKVIQSLKPNGFSIPLSLQGTTELINENFWDRYTAQQMAKKSVRQHYLGIDLANNQQTEIEFDYSNLELNKTEQEAEKKAENTKIIQAEPQLSGRWWNIRNAHPRDDKVRFDPYEHRYKVENDFEYSSASEVAKLFFAEFDLEGQSLRIAIQKNTTAEAIRQGFIRDRNLGIQLHRDIEEWFENRSYTPTNETLTEFNFFIDFYKNNLNGQIPYRTEWTIYDKIHKIAGTVDMVFRKNDGTFAIYDWKRTKSFFRSFYDKGQNICNHLPEGNFSSYAIQSHIYKKILQDFYGIKVSELFLVQFHPEPYNNILRANLEDISENKMELDYGVNMDELVDKLFLIVKANK